MNLILILCYFFKGQEKKLFCATTQWKNPGYQRCKKGKPVRTGNIHRYLIEVDCLWCKQINNWQVGNANEKIGSWPLGNLHTNTMQEIRIADAIESNWIGLKCCVVEKFLIQNLFLWLSKCLCRHAFYCVPFIAKFFLVG